MIRRLIAKAQAACPGTDISVGDWAVKSTWRVDYPAGATDAQRAAVAAVIAAFDPEAPPVPEKVALWQARVALAAAGLMPQVQAALASLNDPRAQAIWEYGNEIRRDSPLLAGIATALGLTAAQVDALFRQAAAIDT